MPASPSTAPRSRRISILLIVLIALGTGGWLAWQRWAESPRSAAGNASSPGAGTSPTGAPGTRPAGASGPASPAGTPGSGTGAPAAGGAGQGAGQGGPGGRWAGGNRAMPVSAGTVERRDLRVLQPAIGTILALNTAVVRARVEGELRAIHFTEGQQVRAGQLLAEIDPRAYEVQLAQAEGQLARDQAQLANAQIDLARYRDLAARDSIARQQVDTQEALVKQLSGTIRIDQAAVDNARLQLSYTRVTAPISGQVGLRQVDLGNIVRAADAQGLLTITQTQPISVVFSIPEAALPKLRAGMRGAERPAVEAWDREMKSRLALGAVSSLDNAIDPTTGTIRVKAQFDNRDAALYPNQFVNIRLHLDTLSSATVVPGTSVQRGAAGSFVYRIGDDGAVSVRAIETLAVEGNWTAVRGELSAGDRVVTDGADRLREGARVEVIAPTRGRGNGPAGSERSSAPARANGGPTPGDRPTSTPASDARPADPAAPGRAASAAASSSASPGASPDPTARPPWLDRLPPAEQERFIKMPPEERQKFIDQMRERRRQQQGG